MDVGKCVGTAGGSCQHRLQEPNHWFARVGDGSQADVRDPGAPDPAAPPRQPGMTASEFTLSASQAFKYPPEAAGMLKAISAVLNPSGGSR